MEECKIKASTSQENSFKDNIVFINRSPISSWACLPSSNTDFKSIMKDINSSFNTATLYCNSDDIKIMERVGGRFFLSYGSPKEIRQALCEDNDAYQLQIKNRYETLLDSGYFDETIYTTDVKQAQAQIFKVLDLQNWDAFKAMYGKK